MSKSGVGRGHKSGEDRWPYGKGKERFIVKRVDLRPERRHGCDSSKVPVGSSVTACPVLGNV